MVPDFNVFLCMNRKLLSKSPQNVNNLLHTKHIFRKSYGLCIFIIEDKLINVMLELFALFCTKHKHTIFLCNIM